MLLLAHKCFDLIQGMPRRLWDSNILSNFNDAMRLSHVRWVQYFDYDTIWAASMRMSHVLGLTYIHTSCFLYGTPRRSQAPPCWEVSAHQADWTLGICSIKSNSEQVARRSGKYQPSYTSPKVSNTRNCDVENARESKESLSPSAS